MKRRGFLKFLGMAAVAPVAIAKAIEHAREPQRPMYILAENVRPLPGWPLRARKPIGGIYIKEEWETVFCKDHMGSAWVTEAQVMAEMRTEEKKI